MVRYILYVLLVAAVEVGILTGISVYFDYNFLTTMFFGSFTFALIAFVLSSSGDVLTKGSEMAAFDTLLGAYKPRHEKATLRLNPFLVGSLLCLVVYVVLELIL
ncbi:hypothetical protein [Fredinandcohnia sp. 179-A 10B2 NHS]|uniref:hypothetical protein n=1 Tax=Fredinandcohnia sp. 179-A 10B2 NHS TaxID=3235176 RepID=UPI0039A0878C